MIDSGTITAAIGIPCMISRKMNDEMEIWESAYTDKSSWLSERVRSMRLPATIAREMKRLTLTEIFISAKNPLIDKSMQDFLCDLRENLDYGLAMGGILFKPCYTTGGIYVDIITQNQYIPVNFTDGFCDALICPESITIGKHCYTRIEYHVYDREKRTHTIENRCYRSENEDVLGTECSLSEIPAWKDILPRKVFDNADKPLFAVFRMPDANHVDPLSPLGVSVYADAIDFIKDADEQWERILWELESSERAIDASEDLFRLNPNGKPVLPKGRERMYHCLERTGNDNAIYNTFSPAIRDASQFNALNQMLRRIENAVGLSYGTISEISEVEKTAEEIRSSKHRSFTRICDIQRSLKSAIENLFYIMQYYIHYYTGNEDTDDALICTFGDGVLEDVEAEFQRRLQLTQAGYYKPEKLLAWYFECSEEDAALMIPQKTDSGGLFDGFGGGT